jgi:hypothetical protein
VTLQSFFGFHLVNISIWIDERVVLAILTTYNVDNVHTWHPYEAVFALKLVTLQGNGRFVRVNAGGINATAFLRRIVLQSMVIPLNCFNETIQTRRKEIIGVSRRNENVMERKVQKKKRAQKREYV